jgi:hypothetical protein
MFDQPGHRTRTRRALVGAAGGVGATVVMTGFMRLLRPRGAWAQSPQVIQSTAAERAGMRGAARAAARTVAWLPGHLGMGAVLGTAYGLVPHRPGIRTSVPYALATWAVSYAGVMPALRLYPTPGKDIRSRGLTTLAAHVVFGAALGPLTGALLRPGGFGSRVG